MRVRTKVILFVGMVPFVLFAVLLGLPLVTAGSDSKMRQLVEVKLSQLHGVTVIWSNVTKYATDSISADLELSGKKKAIIHVGWISPGSFDGTQGFVLYGISSVMDTLFYFPVPDIQKYKSWADRRDYKTVVAEGHHYILNTIGFDAKNPGYFTELFGNKIRTIQDVIDHFDEIEAKLILWRDAALAERKGRE